MSMLIDIGAIKDEDLLRRMWQDTDDFCRKKEIRAHMYKLRETRLRDFYSGDMDAGIGLSKTPLTASHGDSLADQSFQSFKTKEIRDSESPTREFKYGAPANLGGWNVMTSSELSNDGKMHTTHSLATTGGVHDLADGQAKFTGRNEKLSSVAFDGDDKNYTTSSGENSNTVLEENIVQGDENNRRIENKKSTVTTSSKVIRSHYESGDNGYEPQYAPSETIERKIIYNEAPQPRVMSQQPNSHVQRNVPPPTNNRNEQLISRTVEYPDPLTKVIREVKSLPDGSTITTTKYETRSANSELWSSSNSNKNTSTSTSRVVKEDRAELNRIQYIIDDRGNQVPYQPNCHVQNKTTKDIEGYKIVIDTTNDRNIPTNKIVTNKTTKDAEGYEVIIETTNDRNISKTVKKDLARDMERLTDQDDVVRTTTTTKTTTKTNQNNDVYDVKRPIKVDKKPVETEYTRKRISVDLDPTHEAFAKSLRCVSPVSDRDSIRSHRSTTSSIRSSISPDKGFRARRSNSRDTDISQISSQTVTKSGPTPGLKSPQRASPSKRPDSTTTTIKTEKITRVPEHGKPNDQTPRRTSKVTDLDTDDTVESKTTTVTSTTTTDNKDRPKTNRPPFVRSETYEERCRKILGMPEPDEQPKVPGTRRSKFSTTTTDFIENEKVDIVKNRTVLKEQRPNSKSPEKSPVRKPSGRSPTDEHPINTNTFDRKKPRQPDGSSPDNTTQMRPKQNIPESKSPNRVSPDRKSPSKIVETTTTTITRKTPRGPSNEVPDNHSPDRKTPTRPGLNQSPERKPSKAVETTTTRTTVTRDSPRRPVADDHVSPDRKSPTRRPTTDRGSPDRKTVVTKKFNNLETFDVDVNEETVINRKLPRLPTDSGPTDRRSPNRKTTVTETTVTLKTPRPANKKISPDSDEELIDEIEPEFETFDRKPTGEPISDDETPNRSHKIIQDTTDMKNRDIVNIKSTTIIEQRRSRGPHDDEPEYLPETDEDVPRKRGPDTDDEITDTVITETVLDRNQPSKTSRRPNDGPLGPTEGTRKIPRRPDHDEPNYESSNYPSITTETDEELIETTTTRKSKRLPNDALPKTPNSTKIPSHGKTPDHRSPNRPSTITTSRYTTETNEENIDSSVGRKTQRHPKDESPDRNLSDRKSPSRPFTVTEEITKTTTIRKPTYHPNDVASNRTPDRRSPDRNVTTNLIETNHKAVETSDICQFRRLPNDESPDRRPSKTIGEFTETDEETIESSITRKTPRGPIAESPDRQSPDRIKTHKTPTPDRSSPGHQDRPYGGEISNTTVTRKSPDRQSPERRVPDRRSPDRLSKVTEEITETKLYRQIPDQPLKVTTNITETDDEFIETTYSRKNQHQPDQPEKESRQSPGRTIPTRSPHRPSKFTEEITETTVTRKSPDRRLPNRPTKDTTSIIETDEEVIETTTTRKTPQYPGDKSPDRRSPSRQSIISHETETPDRRSPDRRSPDRRSPDRRSPDRRSPDRPSKIAEEITETTVTRKTPDRRSPDRPSRDTTNVRGNEEEIVETIVTRKIGRPDDESPDRRSPVTRKTPDRQSPGRTMPVRRSPDRSSKIKEETTVLASTVTRKTPDRCSPGRASKVTDEEVIETTVTRKTQRRPNEGTPVSINPQRKTVTKPARSPERQPNDQSPDRRSPNRTVPDRRSPGRKTVNQSNRSPERPSKITDKSPDRRSPIRKISKETITVNRQSSDRSSKVINDREIVETTVTRKVRRRPDNGSPDRRSPNRNIQDRSPDRKPTTKVTETRITRTVPLQSERSPDRPYKTTRNRGDTDDELVETTVTRKTIRRPIDQSPDRRSPDRKTVDRPERHSKPTKYVTESTTTSKSWSPDRKIVIDKPRGSTIESTSPVRSSKKPNTKNDEQYFETSVTRKIHRHSIDESPDRKSPSRQTTSTTRNVPTNLDRSPDRLHRRPKESPTSKTTTVTKTTTARRPTPSYTDETSPLRRKPTQKAPEEFLESDEPIEEPTRICRGDKKPEPGYLRPTQSSKPKAQSRDQKAPEEFLESDEPIEEPTSILGDKKPEPRYLRPTQSSKPKAKSPDRKISTATYVNETDEEVHETTIKRKSVYEQPEQNTCEPITRRPVSKIPDSQSPDHKAPTKTTTYPVPDGNSPTRRISRPRSPIQDDIQPIRKVTTKKTIIYKQPGKDRPRDRSPERLSSEESDINEETVQVNQYGFIENEIRDIESTRQSSSERPGPLRRKPDDVEVIFERAIDTTTLTEVDNSLVEEEREVGCKLTGEPEEPKRQPSKTSPQRGQSSESSPSRLTTLKKSSKFDDNTEEITTTVERRTIRRPTVPGTSPDRRTPRSREPHSPETSPVRRNIIKTVKEIIISPTQPRRTSKQPRSPETSPSRRTSHVTTVTKTILDHSTPTTPQKSRPQTTPSQPGQRKPNIDRINSEVITDRDEKRTTTTTTKLKQKTAPEIIPSSIQRYTTKTESPIARPIKKKPVESTMRPNEITEEVFVKKDVKKLCDLDVCGPRPLTNGSPTPKRAVPKQDTPIRPISKIAEKIDRYTSNTTSTQTNKRSSVTERKNTAPIIPSSRVPATDKFGRSASENQIRTTHTPKIEVNEPVNKERRPSLKSKSARPTKCIATKTINITNTNLVVDSDEMDIIIDIQQAKSSREPSPNKMVPVPVSPEIDTGPSRYPDNVTEPEDDRKPRRKVTNIPIYEEETSTFVSCDITEMPADHVPHYDDLQEGNVDESDDDVDQDRIVKVTDNDECLLSVSDKVSRFINLADETVTSKTIKKTEVERGTTERRRPIAKDLENDDCLLSVSDKVSKFITTAEEFNKPKASADFVTVEKINETENRRQPKNDRPQITEDEIYDEEEEITRVDTTNRINARKVTKVVEKKPKETVITTTTTTTTRKTKPVEPTIEDEEITVTRPKETKVSTIASRFTKPNDQLSRQSSIKRITTDKKVSSIRSKFDKNVEPEDGTDEPFDEPDDRYEAGSRGREPFFLNQNLTNNHQTETISKIVQSSFVDQEDNQPPKGSVTDRFKPNTAAPKVKKITPTPILQSTEVMKKAKEIFESKPNERPKQIDILSRPSVWKYKTNDVKLTDIGVTKTSTKEEIDTSEEESVIELQPEAPKTPKLSARDEFTLKNLRDVTNISSKKDLFERKFSSDRITTTTTTTNREFSQSPIGGSPATTPTDSQGRYLPSNKPSYMNHTVSSLEHINRRDSRSHYISDQESIEENNSVNSTKFGVELKRVDSQNATKTRRKSSSTEIPCIEEIWDLELLEKMLETVVGYEHRRRIRSQIRIIKKQIEEEEEMHTSAHHTSSEIITKRISKERTRSPTSKQTETVTTTTTRATTPKSQPGRKISPMRTVTKTTRVVDEPDQKVSKVVTTTTTISKGNDIADDGKPIWMNKNLLKKPSDNQIKTPSPSSTTTSSSTTRKFNTSSFREVEKTDSVTSSYGIGPTDENGKPLFGIRALKKQALKTEQPKEPVYSTDSDTYHTDEQTRKITESVNLRSPQKIHQTATTKVKKSTKKFIQHEIDDEPDTGAEEIEEYEYESNARARSKFTKEVHSNVKSFLGSEKTYSGFNDVIDRMKNADNVHVEGDTESDREARALLNKFLGASILVQATESVLPDGVKVTQKTTRTLKSDSPASSANRQVTTTKLTKVKSSTNSNSKDSASSNNTGAVATTITTTAVNDIDSIWDETYLKKLLEQSSSYEERRQIRARIRQIMADKEACTDVVEQTTKDLSASSINTILTTSSSQSSEMDNTNDNSSNDNNSSGNTVKDGQNDNDNKKDDPKTEEIDGGKTTTEIVKETKKDDNGGVTTTTTKVTTRTVTAAKPVSPFAKFRQLDKQASTQSPPNSPHNPNTPKTPGQTSAPIFKFTDPALSRRVATFKEQLLQWCQIKTREYENVKIENFSTSWSDGLAFCALIHHFRPDAFDYTKLVPTQRRYNFDLAFRVADEKAGIAPLLDVEDMVVMRKPDWKCVFTYVQSIHRRFKDAD